MIAIYAQGTDRLVSAKSDDGLVEAVQVPMTTLYGDFVLIDLTTGRRMSRAQYEDVNRPIGMGALTGERVPADVWASAVTLMAECDASIRGRGQRLADEALARDLARYDSPAERIAQDMDQPWSNL